MWVYNFEVPFPNNLSERGLRGVKSKQKASGQFWNIESAKFYATIRTYIETCQRNIVTIFFRKWNGERLNILNLTRNYDIFNWNLYLILINVI